MVKQDALDFNQGHNGHFAISFIVESLQVPTVPSLADSILKRLNLILKSTPCRANTEHNITPQEHCPFAFEKTDVRSEKMSQTIWLKLITRSCRAILTNEKQNRAKLVLLFSLIQKGLQPQYVDTYFHDSRIKNTVTVHILPQLQGCGQVPDTWVHHGHGQAHGGVDISLLITSHSQPSQGQRTVRK